MLIAITSLTILGATLGLGLGIAARKLKVEEVGLASEIEKMMPGSQCGQCGFPGCAGASKALAEGKAPVTVCPPGGRELALALAAKLGISADLSGAATFVPSYASVHEEICIGCTKCFKACPTDAIHGAVKQIHSVLKEACTGCAKCVDACPTEALSLVPIPLTLHNWVWHAPANAQPA
jgi:electron transport complex protein RnfB